MVIFNPPSFCLITAVFAVSALAESYPPWRGFNLLSSGVSISPLEWLGANGQWFPGPDVNGISSDVPDGCTVEQAAYVVRHGSRYPDSSAYMEWTNLSAKIQAAGDFTACGSLSFLKDWMPVLKNPAVEISAESITGYREAFDLGYTLRARYPTFYTAGQSFMAWANIYPRVVATAQNFVRGYLGASATTLGTVITVDSTGGADMIGNSLSPSDSCPLYVDGNGGTQATTWDAIYLPPITARLNKLITGNLTLTDSDVSIFPYLCGFETQITGRISPWCGVFTDFELLQYEYRQDLRYYYGSGPGTGLPSTMMLPFLNSLIGLLEQGPGITGKSANGSSYQLSPLIMAFANDGQINQLVTASGVFDDQPALSGSSIPRTWRFITSRFVNMRGTIAFERLSCGGSNEKYVRILLNDAVYPLPSCKDGPGQSCALGTYVDYVKNKYAKSGNWAENCNITTTDGQLANTTVAGASFFTDLGLQGLATVVP